MVSVNNKRTSALWAAHLLFLVFKNSQASQVIVTFEHSDGTFEINIPLTFVYIKTIGNSLCGAVHLVEIGEIPIQYVLKVAKTGKEEQLVNEWEASKRLPHNVQGLARVLKLHAIGKASGIELEGDALLEEFVDYPNLFDIEFEQNKTQLKTILSVGHGLVECFELLRKGDVYHMDVKPDNILYDPVTNEVVLLDLGLAYFEGSSVWKGNKVCGTVPYMCPCLVLQEPNHKCDIRSMMFVLILSTYNGNVPWLDSCHKLQLGQGFFLHMIAIEKRNFETELENNKIIGPVLQRIFLRIRDEVLKPEAEGETYSVMRNIFATELEKLKINPIVSVAYDDKKGEKKEKSKAVESENDYKKINPQKMETKDKNKLTLETEVIHTVSHDEVKNNEKKRSCCTSGVNLKPSSLIKTFVRGVWRKSKVTV